MPFLKTKVSDNNVMAQFGGSMLPATLGETTSAAAGDPTLAPTELIGTEIEIAREEGRLSSGAQLPGQFQRTAEQDDADDLSPFIEPADANERYKDLGLKFQSPVRERVAEILAEQKRDEIIRHDVIARGPQGIGAKALQLGSAFARAAIDPINVASVFVPILSQARTAGLIARFGSTRGRAASGVVEGSIGNALVEVPVAGLARQQQLDYEMSDALVNIAFGGILGGGLHVATGRFADMLRKRGAPNTPPALEGVSPEGLENALKTAVAQITRGVDVDVTPVIAMDRALRGGALRGSTALTGGALTRDAAQRVDIPGVEQPRDLVGTIGATEQARAAQPELFESLDKVNAQVSRAESRLMELEARLAEPEDPMVALSDRLLDIEQRLETTTDGRTLRRLRRERAELLEDVGAEDVSAAARKARAGRTRARTEIDKVSDDLERLRGEQRGLEARTGQAIENARPTPERTPIRRMPSRLPQRVDAITDPVRSDEQRVLDIVARAETELERVGDLDQDIEFNQTLIDDIGDDLTPAERAQLEDAAAFEGLAANYETGIRAAVPCLGRNL